MAAALSLTNFRRFGEFSLALNAPQTILVGPNGSGKSSILEAYNLLATARSMRGGWDEHLIRYDQSLARVEYRDEHQRLECVMIRQAGRTTKQFFLGEGLVSGKDLLGRLPAVLFSAEVVDAIRTGPAGRRRLLTTLTTQWRPAVATTLLRYAQALKERNALLLGIRAGMMQPDLLDQWDAILAQEGARIYQVRAELVAAVTPLFVELTGRFFAHAVKLGYLPSGRHTGEVPSAPQLQAQLGAARQGDCTFGTTSVGPHRDDLDIQLEQHSILKDGSRGEVRLVSFLLILGAYQLLAEGGALRFLFDDLTAEFDPDRLKAFAPLFKNIPLLATTTDPKAAELFSSADQVALKRS